MLTIAQTNVILGKELAARRKQKQETLLHPINVTDNGITVINSSFITFFTTAFTLIKMYATFATKWCS
jgi:hypothetical protein